MKSGTHVPLLEYTKVQIIETTGGFTWFTVLEGGQKRMVAALGEANAKQYLGSKASLQVGAMLFVKYQKVEAIRSVAKRGIFTQQTASLSIDGIQALVTLNTDLGREFRMYAPLPLGLYKIGIPEHPHNKNMTAFYRDRVEPNLRNDQVWFPIEYGDNSRFVHVGNISEGCVTVMSLDKWNGVSEALLRHRIPGTNYLGHVTVSK